MDRSLIAGEPSMKKLQFQTPNKLNDDLINEVINCLPAISNFRFKCVSKQWHFLNIEALKRKSQTLAMSGIFYSTMSGTETGVYVNYARTQKGLRNEDSSIDGTLSFLPEHKKISIHGSCNGLLLCEVLDKNEHSIYLSDHASSLYVCNPVTRNWVGIPYDYTKRYLVMILDFNPLVSVHFNVITIRTRRKRPHRYTFEIFSSNTKECKVNQVTNPVLRQCTINHYATVIFRGLIFCLNLENTDVMGFDMEGNCCRKIELPGKSHQKVCFFFSYQSGGSLRESDGCLCQSGGSLHYYYKSGSELYFWKLVDYESGSWSLKSNFRVTGPLGKIRDLKFHPGMDEIVLLRIKNKVHSYNMQTTEMIELCSLRRPFCFFPYSPCYLEGFGKHGENK